MMRGLLSPLSSRTLGGVSPYLLLCSLIVVIGVICSSVWRLFRVECGRRRLGLLR